MVQPITPLVKLVREEIAKIVEWSNFMEVSATKRIARNFSWLLTGNVISGIANFLSIIYIARALGATAFGLFNFAQAFLVYLVLLVDSGLSMLGTREIARDRERAGRISINIFVLRLLIALGVFFLSILFLCLVPLSLELRLFFIFTFLFVFYRAINADWFFQGMEKMQWIAFSKVTFSFLTLGLIVFLVKGPADLIKVPFIQFACGFLISLLILFVIFRRIAPAVLTDLKPQSWTLYFLSALPLGASMVMIQINYNMDTIMLGFMDQAAVVGYYNAAYKTYYVLLGLYVAWQSTALPVMNKKMKDGIDQAISFSHKYTRLTLLAFVPLCLVVFLLAPSIIDLIFGKEYVASGFVLQLLIWTFVPILIGSCYSTMWLIPAGKFNEFFWLAGAGAIINVCLNIILIPRYSMYGAAAATIVSETISVFTAACLAQRVSRLNLFKFVSLPLMLSVVSLVPYLMISTFTKPLPPMIGLGLAGTAFLAIYALLALVLERSFIFKFVKEILSKQ